MKRLPLILLVLLSLTACAHKADGPFTGKELTVFAAASLQEALTEIGELYQKDRPNVTLVFNFDSSGTLKTQIEEGASCDLFLSAGRKQMDALDASAASAAGAGSPEERGDEALDFVLPDTRVDLLENKVVLAVPEGNPAGITGYDGLAERLEEGSGVLLCMGNSDVPVGQYAQKLLAFYGLDEAALAASGLITYGSNVKEVTTQVSEGAVDCGIIYATDALSAGLTAVDSAAEEMCGQVVYPAAVLTAGKNQGGARDFLAFLRTGRAAEVFRSMGFIHLG